MTSEKRIILLPGKYEYVSNYDHDRYGHRLGFIEHTVENTNVTNKYAVKVWVDGHHMLQGSIRNDMLGNYFNVIFGHYRDPDILLYDVLITPPQRTEKDWFFVCMYCMSLFIDYAFKKVYTEKDIKLYIHEALYKKYNVDSLFYCLRKTPRIKYDNDFLLFALTGEKLTPEDIIEGGKWIMMEDIIAANSCNII